MGRVLLTETGSTGIFTITINRPEKRNAINFQIISEFRNALEVARKDKNIKMLVIRGAGSKAFCSGGDLHDFHNLKTAAEAEAMLSEMGSVLYELAMIDKLTVAYMNGIAVGGGCEIAAACDVRIANRNTVFGFVQADQGITTGWGGGTLLMEKINTSEALQLLLSASLHTAEEGEKAGFITRLVENEEGFLEYLQSFGNKNPEVVRMYKQILIDKWEKTNLKRRMEEEIQRCSVLWESDEHLSAVKQFNKRVR